MTETLRNGRFVLLGALGEGSQGRTFEAVDKREGRPVAIKRFDVRTAKTWKDAELAEREARILQSLSHPRLPRYVDHFEEGGALYLVMEKIEGETLAEVKKRCGPLSEPEVVRFLREASEVLEYLHDRSPPVVHRDFKPGNVLRRPDGSFAFVDFGAVRDKLRPEGGSTIVGTFGYMAPEQFQGRALPASDVYAIGATALALLTGCEPEHLPHRGLAVDVRASLEGRASDSIVRVLERMLDPDPEKRASRIAPLLRQIDASGARRPGASWPAQDPRHEAPWDALRKMFPRGFDMHARQYERWAEELERLASRGGADAESWRRGADRIRAAVRAAAERQARKADRRERREARRAARRRRRQQTRSVGTDRRGAVALPWPIRLVLAIGFSLAFVAVALAMRVVVPLVLALVSMLFARRRLAKARVRVRSAGRTAMAAIARSRTAVMQGSRSAEPREPLADAAGRHPGSRIAEHERRARVGDAATEDERRVRVDDEALDDEADRQAARDDGEDAGR